LGRNRGKKVFVGKNNGKIKFFMKFLGSQIGFTYKNGKKMRKNKGLLAEIEGKRCLSAKIMGKLNFL
jgi:hypothetical protein